MHRFIALSESAKSRFVAAGLPAERIAVKPNFVFDPGMPVRGARHGALFVGRLSAEKGLTTLLRAWREVHYPLRILGAGPLAHALERQAPPEVTFAGHCTPQQVAAAMRQALFLVLPSECMEGFPLVLAEAFAHGLPVLASRIGVMAEAVHAGTTGLHFSAGSVAELAEQARWAAAHEERMLQMGAAARCTYTARYGAEANYEQLLRIYREAIRGAEGTAR